MNRYQDKMEDLLANKRYEHLLPEEKEWVDRQYTAEEYNAMRRTLLGSLQSFGENRTRPNPEIKSRLRQKLKGKKAKPKVTPLLNYRIPAWQAVAAFALVLFFIPQLQQQQSTDPDKVFIYQTDTVFKAIPFETMLNPIVDTLSDIPQVKKILNRTNRSPIKRSAIVFSADAALSANLSHGVADHFSSDYDTASIENIIARYLKDSVNNYRVDVDTGFQDMGRVY